MDPLDYMIAGLGSWLILSVVSATAWSFVATRCKRRARELAGNHIDAGERAA